MIARAISWCYSGVILVDTCAYHGTTIYPCRIRHVSVPYLFRVYLRGGTGAGQKRVGNRTGTARNKDPDKVGRWLLRRRQRAGGVKEGNESCPAPLWAERQTGRPRLGHLTALSGIKKEQPGGCSLLYVYNSCYYIFLASSRNLARPMSVRGCFSRPRMESSGQVHTSAPFSAHFTMCRGVRMEAASTSVLKPWML